MTTQISTYNIQSSTLATLDGPTVTNIQVTDSSYNVIDDTAVMLTGGYIKITGTNFSSGCTVTIGSVSATSVTFVNSTTLNVQVPASAAGTYVVYVINSDGGVAIRVNGLTYSSEPTWVTSSSLNGESGIVVSIQLSATGASTYTLQSGSTLPTGLTLSSGGLISGTVTIVSETVYNFTVIATDAELQDSPRSFSITITVGDPQFKYVTTLLSPTLTTVPFNDDASTNNFVVTVAGDTRPNNFNPYTPGYYSFNFTAKTQYVSVPATTALTTFTGDFTFEAWVYPSDVTITYWGIWDSRQSGATAQAMVFSIEPLASPVTGQGRMKYFNGTSYFGTGIVYYNQWTHVAFVRSGTTLTYYVNGVASGTSTISGTQTGTATSNPIYIGSKDNGTTSYGTNGYISNFRIVNGTAVYTGNFTPSTQPLPVITNTVLLTAQDNSFVDESAASRVLTPSSAIISRFNPFLTEYVKNTPYYSGYFDGNGDYLNVAANNAFGFGTGDFTVECWVYPTVNARQDWVDITNGTERVLLYYSGSAITFYSVPPNAAAITGPAMTLNKWTHLAISKQSGNTKMFVDGVQVGSTYTSNQNYGTTAAVTIGKDSVGSTYVTGSMSNVRIVKGTAVYTGNFTPPTGPLTAISGTSLLTCQSSTFIDNSTNNFAITVNGNITPITASPFADLGYSTTVVPTTYGSTYFDGTGDYLTAPSTGFDISTSTSWTIELWFYPTLASTLQFLWQNYTTSGATIYGQSLSLQANNTLIFDVWQGSSAASQFNLTSSAITINQWNHVAIVRNASGTNNNLLFVNGVLAAQGSWTTHAAPGSTLTYIGARNYSSIQNFYRGHLSSFRVVKGTALYTANFAPPAGPLTAIDNTSFLTCQTNQPVNNNAFLDSSNNNFPVTRVGNPTQGAFSPYGGTWSNYFDGTGDYLSAPNTSSNFDTADFTIEGWFYKTTSASKPVVSNQDGGSDNNYFVLDADNTQATFQLRDNSSQAYAYGPASTSDTWNHIAVTRNSGSVRVFINGVSGTPVTITKSVTSRGTIIGGFLYTGFESSFLGYISNLRVIKGTALYTANFTPPVQPLRAISGTSLLTCADNRLIDDSPNNFTITRAGDVRVQSFNPFGIRSAITPLSYSASLDGNGDYLSIPYTTLLAQTSTYTIEMWIYPTNTYSQQYIYGRNAGGYFCISWAGTYLVVDKNGVGPQITGTSTLGLNTWHHVAMTYDGTTTRLFANGVLQGSVSGTGGEASGATTIGFYEGNGTSSFYGRISNVRFVKGTALYTANFTTPTAPLTAITGTSLLTCRSNRFIDESSNELSIATAGDIKVITQNPFGDQDGSSQSYTPAIFGGSMYFDGTGDYLTIPASAQFRFAGDFTIEGWMYFTNVAGASPQTLFAVVNGATVFDIRWFTTRWQITLNAGSGTDIGTTPAPVNNSWVHVAAVRSGTSIRLYINGMYTGTTLTNSSILGQSTTAASVGATSTGANIFTGYIADVSVVNGVARYIGNFVPPTAPVSVVKNTSLKLNGTAPAIYNSSIGTNLETVGDAKVSTTVTKYGNTSMSFDGNGDYLWMPASRNFDFSNGDWTIECWINFNSVANVPHIWQYGANSASRANLNLTTAKLGVFSGSIVITGATTITTGTWYHVAVVFTVSNTTTRLFLNGTVDGTSTSFNSYPKNAADIAFMMGHQPYSGAAGDYLNGYLSDFRITKGFARYTSNFTPPSSSFSTK